MSHRDFTGRNKYHDYGMTVPRSNVEYRMEKAIVHVCDRKFGTMWHGFRWFKKDYPFILGERMCYCCEKQAVKRVWVNNWGTVCQFDLCAEHVERYANKCVETVDPYDSSKEEASVRAGG